MCERPKLHCAHSEQVYKVSPILLKRQCILGHWKSLSVSVKKKRDPWTNIALRMRMCWFFSQTLLLTLIWQLAHIGGRGHVEHIIDSCVDVVASLDVVFAVGLVALLVPAVLQTVPLQVLERRCATWGPGGRRGKCWLTVTSPPLTCSPSSHFLTSRLSV